MKVLRTTLLLINILLSAFQSFASDFFWVNGTGNWSDFANHWQDSSGTFYTRMPSDTDNVYFNAASFTAGGQTVTIDVANAVCQRMDWTNAGFNPTLAKLPANDSLFVYGSLILKAGMTNNYNGTFVFKTIDADSIKTNGIVFISDIAFIHLGEYQLKSAVTVNGNIIVESGTIKTNNFNINAHRFNLNFAFPRNIQLGTSTITITRGNDAWRAEPANLTLDAATAVFIFNYTGVDTIHFYSAGSGYIYNSVIFPKSHIYLHESATFNTLTFSVGAKVLVTAATNQTVTTISLSGTCGDPIFFGSDDATTQVLLTQTSGNVTADYVYLQGINGTGGATFTATNSIDEGNNSGWTITPAAGPANLYWIGGTGNWFDKAHWSTTSGGATANCVPGPSTNVFFDANSFSAAGQTVTVDYNAFCNNMTWTGANAPNFSGSYNLNIQGSLVLNATLNLPFTGQYIFYGTGAISINTFNRTLNGEVFLNNATGNFSLASAFTSNEGIDVNDGSFTTNNNAVTAAYVRSNNINTIRSLTIGTSVITLTGSGDAWDLDATGLTFSSGNSVFNMNHTGVNAMVFKGADNNYYNINLNTSATEIYGANNFHWIRLAKGNKLSFESSVTNSYDSLIAIGTCGKPVIISSTEILGAPATIRRNTAGFTTVNFAYISNVIADSIGLRIYTANSSELRYTTTGWTNTTLPGTGTKFYWIGGTGSWNDTLHWSLSSGGTPTACLPTIKDTVYFDANSFSAAGQIVSVNVDAYCNLMDWTAATNNPNFNILQTLTIRRDLLMNAAMTTSGARSGLIRFLPTANNCNLNTQNVTLNASILLEGSVLTDQLSLANNLTMDDSLNSVNVIQGTFLTNNRNITASAFNLLTGNDKQITLGSSVINLKYGWYALGITSGLTITPGTSHIIVNGSQAGEYFHGAGKTYNNVTIYSPGTGITKLTGSNTFNQLTIKPGVDLEIEASSTQTTSKFRAIGLCTDSISLFTSTAGSIATITQTLDSILVECAYIQDITAAGLSIRRARFSTNGGNNTGWTFVATPPVTSNFTYPVTLCRGTAINFTNTSTNISGSISNLSFRWSFGDGDTSLLTSPSHTYTQGGRKGVTLVATYTNECEDTRTDSIDVNDLQVQLESSATSGIICAGDSVTFRTLNNATTYQFFRNNVAMAPASVDTFITVTNLQNNDSVYVVATVGGCSFPSNVKLKFTVNPAPTVSLVSTDADNIICEGDKVKFTGSGANEYLFYKNGNALGFFSNIDSLVTTTLANGDIIRVEGKNSTTQCSAFAPQTFSMTVNPLPTTSLTSSDIDNVICAGESVTFTASGANEYQFTIAGVPQGAYSPTNTFTTTAIQQGNTVKVSGRSAGCIVKSNGFTFTVNTLPTVTLTNSTSNNTLCAGETVTFTGGGATAYEFFVNNVSAQGPSVTNTFDINTLANGDVVTVEGQTNNCINTTTPNTMTVVALPNVTFVSSDPNDTICGGESVTFTASGATTYEYFIDNVSQGAPSANNTFTTTSILNGQTVSVVGYTNGCGANGNASFTYYVKPAPFVSLFSSDFDNSITRCEEVTFTALGASMYEFFIDGVSQGASSPVNQLTTTTLTNGQTIMVTGTSNTCPGNSNSITFTVLPAPPVTLTANTSDTICAGTTVTFIANGADEYELFINGLSQNAPAPGNVFTTSSLNHNDAVYVAGYTFNCPNYSDTTVFTVNAYPTVTLTSSDADNIICVNESVTFTGSGATDYEFFVNGVSQGAASPVNTFTTTSLINNQSVSVRGISNGCSSNSNSITTTVNPMPNTLLFSNDPDNKICFGENITFTALNSTQYEFFVNGVSQGPASATNTLTTTTLPSGNTAVTVRGTFGGCTAFSPDTIITNVVPLPPVTLVSSDADNIICAGESVTFTALGASQYRFFVNNVAQGQFSANNVFTSSTIQNNQTIKVTGSDLGCAADGVPTFTMTVKPNPATSLVSSDIDRIICTGDTVTFTASGATTYEFFIDGVSLGAPSAVNTFTTSALVDSNRIQVTGTTNGCSVASGSLLFRVNPAPVVTLTSSDADNIICTGDNIIFTASGASLYQFFINGTPVSNPSATAVRNISTLTNGQTVSLLGINQFGCSANAPQTFTITANPLPVVSLTSSDADNIICTGESVTFTASGAQQYQFYVGNTPVTSLSATNTYTTDSITNSQTIKVRGVSNGCPAFATSTFTFLVNVFPAINLTSSASSNTICEGEVITFKASGANQYEFFVSGTSQGAPSAVDSIVISNLQNGQTVSAKGYNNACASNSTQNFTYTVNPLPVVTFTSSDADNRICFGEAVTFTANGAGTYEYFINNISQGAPSTNTTLTLNEIENGDVITVKGYSLGCGNSSSNNFVFTVDKMNLTLSASGLSGWACQDEPITFVSSGANTYEFFVDGVSQGAASANNSITINTIADGQTVTVKGFLNSTGCTQQSESSYLVSVLDVPTITPPNDTSICEGDTLILSSNNNKGVQWYLNGNPIANEVHATYGVYQSGAYSVEIFRGGDGNIWTIGRNTFGQLGDTTTIDADETVIINGLEDVISVDAGLNFNIVCDSSGKVFAWGQNNFGQLGDGSFSDEKAPKRIQAITNAKQVAAGDEFSVVLTTTGNVYTFGKNDNGQLGQGNNSTQSFPFQINNFTNVKQVAAGGEHAVILKNDNTVFTWGDNQYGQLGQGNFLQKRFPVLLPGLTNVAFVAAGKNHSLAVKTDGTVWVWGNNAKGQLGRANINFSNVPIQVAGITNAIKAAAGDEHTLILTADGKVYAFGGNGYGQLGDNSFVQSNAPRRVTAAQNVNDIACGSFNSYALRNDGTVWAWGLNLDYQLAIGNNNNQNQPQFSKELSGASMIAAGANHAVALATDKKSCVTNVVNVMVNPVPTASITPTATGFEANAGGVSYQWYYNGIAIPTGTQQSLTSTSLGSYQVAVTNASGCTTLSNVFVYTGIQTVMNNNSYLQFYPNPTNGVLYVQLKNEKIGKSENLKIVNLLGSVVFELNEHETGTLNTIDLSDQPAGLYFIHTRFNGQLFIDKIILSKL
jgi:alpha-tubulin suppressor-like RCC1 family protein